jgi:hypothetical protein
MPGKQIRNTPRRTAYPGGPGGPNAPRTPPVARIGPKKMEPKARIAKRAFAPLPKALTLRAAYPGGPGGPNDPRTAALKVRKEAQQQHLAMAMSSFRKKRIRRELN